MVDASGDSDELEDATFERKLSRDLHQRLGMVVLGARGVRTGMSKQDLFNAKMPVDVVDAFRVHLGEPPTRFTGMRTRTAPRNVECQAAVDHSESDAASASHKGA